MIRGIWASLFLAVLALTGCTRTETVRFVKTNGRWEAVEANVPWTYVAIPDIRGLWLTDIRKMEHRFNTELPAPAPASPAPAAPAKR